MVNFPKIAHLHVNFTKKILFSWEIFTYGNISVALMIKIPMLLRDVFFHVSDTVTQPVLGKFPIKVKISMTISNSVGKCAHRTPFRHHHLYTVEPQYSVEHV
jgi:hypothetical protein